MSIGRYVAGLLRELADKIEPPTELLDRGRVDQPGIYEVTGHMYVSDADDRDLGTWRGEATSPDDARQRASQARHPSVTRLGPGGRIVSPPGMPAALADVVHLPVRDTEGDPDL